MDERLPTPPLALRLPVSRIAEVLFATTRGRGAAIAFLAVSALGADTPLAAAAAVPAGLNGSFGGRAGSTRGEPSVVGEHSCWTRRGRWSARHSGCWSTANTLNRRSGFGSEFSVRRNRHVFARGFALKRGFRQTQGPVISNATCGRGDDMASHRNLIERHEGLHVWQQRWFGPLHPLVYVVWGCSEQSSV